MTLRTVSLLALVLLPAYAFSQAAEWRMVGKDITGNISGLAIEKNGVLLAVHDNKLPREPRISRVIYSAPMLAKPLAWPAGAELPIDLEAITEIPGKEGEFIALASDGKAFHIRVSGENVQLLGTFRLPGAKPFLGNNYEGLRLGTKIKSLSGVMYRGKSITPEDTSEERRERNEIVAVWTHRGGSGRDGLVFVAPFTLKGYQFGPGNVYKLRNPWPESNRRDASDVIIRVNGEVVVSTASDPGDDGPFSSTLYSLGKLRKNASGIWELPAQSNHFLSPKEIEGSRCTRKIEAMAYRYGGPCVTDFFVLGTDDENGGGWIR